MPLVQSNLLNKTPASNALQSKLNPPALQPLKMNFNGLLNNTATAPKLPTVTNNAYSATNAGGTFGPPIGGALQTGAGNLASAYQNQGPNVKDTSVNNNGLSAATALINPNAPLVCCFGWLGCICAPTKLAPVMEFVYIP